MNKTTFKNNYNKYFEQLVGREIVCICTNRVDMLQITYIKDNKEKTLTIKASIQREESGLLDFHFDLGLQTPRNQDGEVIIDNVKSIRELELYEAQDMFCKEQALQICYNEDQCSYILIYTDMAEMSLEFFHEKLDAEKFKKISF